MELQVGVKILLKNKDGKYLVVCRSAEKYPEVGAKWDIVGGRIDPGSTLLENLRREVMEETGLEIKYEPKLITAQDILRATKHIVRLTYTGFADGVVKLSDENTEYKWLSLEEISNLEPIDSYFKEVLSHFDLS
ncbi:MAG: NUDIX domain-containing protein [Minisyncoccia bacterium]